MPEFAPRQYTIGADPELFLIDAAGAFVSAHDVIPGNKVFPLPVDDGAIQVDGVAAEFNIDPANTADLFTNNIRSVLKQLQETVKLNNEGLRLIVSPTATFDKKYFKNLPSYAKALGCQPDFNVYSGKTNPPPRTRKPFRTGGGHVHVGWNDVAGDAVLHSYECQEVVRQLDAVLYPMSLLWDEDDQRRGLYGSIGTFREKPYGVEYRPLSNAWVADPDLHVWIFNATMTALECLDLEEKIHDEPFWETMLQDIRKGRNPERATIRSYHDFLCDEFMIPALPKAYI